MIVPYFRFRADRIVSCCAGAVRSLSPATGYPALDTARGIVPNLRRELLTFELLLPGSVNWYRSAVSQAPSVPSACKRKPPRMCWSGCSLLVDDLKAAAALLSSSVVVEAGCQRLQATGLGCLQRIYIFSEGIAVG